MKNMKKGISILLIMTMILTTMGLSVFAEGETPAAESGQTTENTTEVTEPEVTVENSGETAPTDTTQGDAVTNATNEGEAAVQQKQSTESESTDPQAGSQTDPQADSQTDPQADPQTDPQADPQTDPQPEPEPQPVPDPVITITKAEVVDYAGGTANIAVEWTVTGEGVLKDFAARTGSGYQPVEGSVTETGALFSLEPGKKYKFRVSATLEDGTPEGKEIKSEWSEIVVTERAAVKDLEAHPSYNAVVLDWEKSDVADHYVVYRGSKKVATVTNDSHTSKYDEDRVLYTVKKLEEFKKYNFKVVAYYDETSKGGSAKAKDQPVRPITYNLVIKRSIPYGELKKHRGNGPSSVSLQAGQTLKAVGFNSGKYVFEYKGSVFNITKQRISGISCTYSKDITYDKISAESYVNRKGLKSKTKTLIWVSTYTQELYVFKGSKGKWKLKKHWAVSTGKASSPSPTGDKFIKEVWKRLPTRHNLSWWTCYSSMNAFHGTFSSWVKKLGNPASGGCIRNKNENAKWLYNNKNIKMGTTVLIR